MTPSVLVAFLLGLSFGGLLVGLLVRAFYHRALLDITVRLQAVKDSLDDTIRDLDQVEQAGS